MTKYSISCLERDTVFISSHQHRVDLVVKVRIFGKKSAREDLRSYPLSLQMNAIKNRLLKIYY